MQVKMQVQEKLQQTKCELSDTDADTCAYIYLALALL